MQVSPPSLASRFHSRIVSLVTYRVRYPFSRDTYLHSLHSYPALGPPTANRQPPARVSGQSCQPFRPSLQHTTHKSLTHVHRANVRPSSHTTHTTRILEAPQENAKTEDPDHGNRRWRDNLVRQTIPLETFLSQEAEVRECEFCGQ